MNRCKNFVQNVVIVLHFLLAISGLAFVIIGATFKVNLDGGVYNGTELSKYNFSPTLMITIGGVVTLISFLGCCGSVRKSKWMLTMYGILLSSIFFVQLGVGIYIFVGVEDYSNLSKTVSNTIYGDIKDYYKNEKVKHFWDRLQTLNKCCGVNGYEDWLAIGPKFIPASCCKDKENPCSIYTDGCSTKIEENVVVHVSEFHTIAVIMVVIGIIELFAAIFSFYLSYRIPSKLY